MEQTEIKPRFRNVWVRTDTPELFRTLVKRFKADGADWQVPYGVFDEKRFSENTALLHVTHGGAILRREGLSSAAYLGAELTPWQVLAERDDPEGWIENRGVMLCPPEMQVDVKFRDGRVFSHQDANYWTWEKVGGGELTDIIYWRPAEANVHQQVAVSKPRFRNIKVWIGNEPNPELFRTLVKRFKADGACEPWSIVERIAREALYLRVDSAGHIGCAHSEAARTLFEEQYADHKELKWWEVFADESGWLTGEYLRFAPEGMLVNVEGRGIFHWQKGMFDYCRGHIWRPASLTVSVPGYKRAEVYPAKEERIQALKRELLSNAASLTVSHARRMGKSEMMRQQMSWLMQNGFITQEVREEEGFISVRLEHPVDGRMWTFVMPAGSKIIGVDMAEQPSRGFDITHGPQTVTETVLFRRPGVDLEQAHNERNIEQAHNERNLLRAEVKLLATQLQRKMLDNESLRAELDVAMKRVTALETQLAELTAPRHIPALPPEEQITARDSSIHRANALAQLWKPL